MYNVEFDLQGRRVNLGAHNYSRNIDTLGNCCFGCGACESACPAGCITMLTDEEGFIYPYIDESCCLGCGKCDKVCPSLPGDEPLSFRKTPTAWAAHSVDEQEWISSSSGGAFSALARKVLETDGSVYGVAMDKGCRSCSFQVAHTIEELQRMLGSKYLQANPKGVYESVLSELTSGRRVLFCGTPCQTNALASFLQTEWPNLLLVDIICHGVPSPLLWSAYLSSLEQEQGKKARQVEFRHKYLTGCPGKKNARQTTDENSISIADSSYMKMYGLNYNSRPSCYECHAKTRRCADITIGDFWGVGQYLSDFNDERGCSLILVRTSKGEEAVRDASELMEMKETTYAEGVGSNPCEYSSIKKPALRDSFYRDLKRNGYKWVEDHYGNSRSKKRTKGAIKSILVHLGIFKLLRPKAGKMRYGILIQFSDDEG